jgi:vacuolar protein sorting-associated protein 11
LFFTTPVKTICAASVTGKGTEPKVLEEIGASLGCVTMTSDKSELVVGRDDGIYLYGTEGKGSCIAYEGELDVN